MADKTSKTLRTTHKSPQSISEAASLSFLMKTNGYLTSTLYTSESNGDVHLAPDAFLCYKSDSYLLFPLLHPSLERVWHPLSLILYGETMGSGGRSYYVSRSESGETEGVKAEWKLRERESVRGRKRAQKGDHLLTILSNHESDETLHEWQFLRPPLPFLPSLLLRCNVRENSNQKSLFTWEM